MYNLVKRKVVVFDMKFCSHCGHELLDDAFVCPNCGCRVDGVKENINCESQKQDENDVLATVAKVFMILAWHIITSFVLDHTNDYVLLESD